MTISEIPYVNSLGDAFDRLADPAPARRGLLRRRRRRGSGRLRLIAVVVGLVCAGAASAAAVLGGSRATELAANDIICYSPAAGGGVAVLADRGGSPTAACAAAGESSLPASRLVACVGGSGPNGPYVEVYPRRHADECARRHLAALPSAYAGAQARVAALGSALAAVEGSRDCVSFAAFKRAAQMILERLGWSGWSVRERSVLRGGGECAGLAEGGAGQPSINASLAVGSRTLQLFAMPPRSVTGGERAVWAELDRASAAGCQTTEALESVARTDASAHALGVAFAVTREPRFVGVGDGRQPRYEQGCAVMFGVELVPRTRRLDVQILSRAAGSTPAQGATLPASSYR